MLLIKIVHTFLLQSKVHVASLYTKLCIDANSNSTVRDAVHKLTDNSKYNYSKVCDGLGILGSERFTMVDARKALAVQNLLGEDVMNISAVMYDRFLYNHNLYSSKNYTREKRHSNCSVSFVHPNYEYGVILGLLETNPL